MAGVDGIARSGFASGSMIFGVTITTSSMVERFRFLERNSCPSTGMSAMPGILLKLSVVRWSRMPEMPRLCPSLSSTSVSALRVDSAGKA